METQNDSNLFGTRDQLYSKATIVTSRGSGCCGTTHAAKVTHKDLAWAFWATTSIPREVGRDPLDAIANVHVRCFWTYTYTSSGAET